MNGLVYLLNQAGEALAQANHELGTLHEENDRLQTEVAALREAASAP
jgi:cell division protein FtsB